MAPPLGHKYATGHGRPRVLERELARVEEAANHVDRLIEQQVMAALLLNVEPEVEPGLNRLSNSLREKIVELASVVEALRQLAPKTNRSKRQPRPGMDRYGQACQRAAVALDRVIGEENPQ